MTENNSETNTPDEPKVSKNNSFFLNTNNKLTKPLVYFVCGLLTGFLIFGVGGYYLGVSNANISNQVTESEKKDFLQTTPKPSVAEINDINDTKDKLTLLLSGEKYEISKIGNVVGNFVVKNLRIDGFGTSVEFEGEIEVFGEYQNLDETDEDMMREWICMYLTETEANKLPKLENDDRIPWFCFRNRDEAEMLFKDLPKYGEVNVTINNFSINICASDCGNAAELISINNP